MSKTIIVAIIVAIIFGVGGYFIGKGAGVNQGASLYNAMATKAPAMASPSIGSTGPTNPNTPCPAAGPVAGSPCTQSLMAGPNITTVPDITLGRMMRKCVKSGGTFSVTQNGDGYSVTCVYAITQANQPGMNQ